MLGRYCAPHPEVSTAYTGYIMGIMTEAAKKYGTEKEVRCLQNITPATKAPIRNWALLTHIRWLFDTMCGILVDRENHFVIAPQPGGNLTHASASYISIYGKVESSWQKTASGYSFTVTIPANCDAIVRLPDGSAYVQSAGTKIYIMEAPYGY